jgi:hypothetical protein
VVSGHFRAVPTERAARAEAMRRGWWLTGGAPWR